MSQEPTIERQPCGCVTTDTEGVVSYTPCLACALKNAGLMLIEAGKRMHEAAEEERRESEARAEEQRIQAEDFIGGND